MGRVTRGQGAAREQSSLGGRKDLGPDASRPSITPWPAAFCCTSLGVPVCPSLKGKCNAILERGSGEIMSVKRFYHCNYLISWRSSLSQQLCLAESLQ